jgi:hypothetical protein
MKTRLTPLAPLVALAVAFSGCAEDNDASITMRAICVPTDDCTFAETCDAQYIGYPTLDVAVSQSLWLFLEVANQLPNNADAALGRTNTNDAQITEAVIEYERVALPRVAVRSAYLVPANGSAVISVQVIPDSLGAGAVLAGAAPVEAIANVRLRGRYFHGDDFETGEFPVAVRICNGCLGPQCGGARTCPPQSEGQLPLSCTEDAPPAEAPPDEVVP